ncbi:MAG TPA: hypothetical protein VFE51_02795 [Verrucomicrobiae bacterium]|nr:hypothetical protein [Verrucomicrobiae bacterium]
MIRGHATNPFLANASCEGQLIAALRGGLILMAGSTLWALAMRKNNGPFFELGFFWLPCAWMIFPAGALIGSFMPRWIAGRSWGFVLMLGTLIGSIVGLVLAFGCWLVRTHPDLIGLIVNRHSGGYTSYSLSVRMQLQDQAWRMLFGVAPLTAIWIALWTLWLKRDRGFLEDQSARSGGGTESVLLRLDRRFVLLVAWMAAGLAIFATVLLLAVALFERAAHVPVTRFPVVALGSVGLVVLGPFLGPIATGWSFEWAFKYAVVGLPILVAGISPFLVCRDPVSPRAAVLAWCGLITGLLFWLATGVFSLGHCLG